jgi:hypothetical protein
MRIDAVATASYVVTLAAPVAAYLTFRRVRRGDRDGHRLAQTTLLVVCWIAVLALEVRIRLAGGSGELIADAPPAIQPWARGLLIVHVGVAVVTYLAWTWLAVASWRR